MFERNTGVRSLHDLGLPAWFGGLLAGAVGFNAVATDVPDKKLRLRVATAISAHWTPVNLVAIAAHLVDRAATLRDRFAVQKCVEAFIVTMAALTDAALAVTGHSRSLSTKLEQADGEPVEGGADPSPHYPGGSGERRRGAPVNEIRLYPAAPSPDFRVIRRFCRIPVSALSDCLACGSGAVGLQPVGDCLSRLVSWSMAGPALTVRTRPGDNLAVHKALDLARPGDVLVVDARSELVNAIMGELLARYAQVRGVAGIVIDGAIRDRAEISAGGLPVFARGVSHLGPYQTGPGEIHGPISLGGVPVHDGDVVVGDGDGVVVVPRARAEATAKAAENVVASEAEQRRAIDAGRWDRSWVDAAIRLIAVDGTGAAWMPVNCGGDGTS
jgi:regulator of RNase E activity RraA